MKLHNDENNKELSNNNNEANEVLETKLKKRKKQIIDKERAKELTFKVREAPLDVINDPYLIAAKFCGHFCGFFLSGLLIMITLF